MSEDSLQFKDFEELFINNSTFRKVEAYLNRFNPIRVMKMEEMEIRHSAILGWLLDPRENHGLGDGFLKIFLAEALSNNGGQMALDIASSELSDAEVFVEWNGIDIFVKWPSGRKVFIIENKINSTQSENQLEKYWKLVESRFGEASRLEEKYTVHGLFLTLNDEAPNHDHYVTINYASVYNLLDFNLKFHEDTLSPNIRQFIEYYRETVSRICGMDEKEKEMTELARKLYRDNKAVLDFIFDQATTNEFPAAVTQWLGVEEFSMKLPYIFENKDKNKKKIVILKRAARVVSFMPESWINGFGKLEKNDIQSEGYRWAGCEKWWSGYPLISWVELAKSGNGHMLRLYVELGPINNHERRLRLLDQIEKVGKPESAPKAVKFTKTAKKATAQYSKFITLSKPVKDVNNIDDLSEKIQLLLREFAHYIDPVHKAIDSFMKEEFQGTQAR